MKSLPDNLQDLNERQLVRSPNGRWKVVPNRYTADEQQEMLDRLALALHLTSNNVTPSY